MAYASMPVITIHTPKIGGNQLSMGTLTEILQSESVKRLLSRQNVFLHAPLSEGSVTSTLTMNKTLQPENEIEVSKNENNMDKFPELSVIPIADPRQKEEDTSSEASADDEHLLPSKNQGKSEIALFPLQREKKRCGHVELCENVLCEVEFRKVVDNDDVVPLIAVNIETSEIDAPVLKHCDNKKCDALSIDHDRCRRAIVRCHKNDVFKICDICLVPFKTRKAQLKHTKCRMTTEYRHNKTSTRQLMRDRMRVRELQILEAVRLKKQNYSDAMNDDERAIESLQRNTELIVIPRTSPPIQQHPTLRITSVTGAPISGESLRRLVSRSPDETLTDEPEEEKCENVEPLENFSSPISRMIPYITETGTQIITENGTPEINVVDQSESRTKSNLQLKSFLMPIRVIPIAGLKTEPSLMHQTHGVPKFCFVSQNPSISANMSKNPRKILPAVRSAGRNADSAANVLPQKAHFNSELVKRFKKRKKTFQCSFCHKRFSTNWYFKLHIAKHKGEVNFSCTFCGKLFMQQDNMMKHMLMVHKEQFARNETIEKQENGQCLHCIDCKIIFKSTGEMINHNCQLSRRNVNVIDDNTSRVKTKRGLTEETTHEEIKQRRSRVASRQNRDKKGREVQKEQTRGAKTRGKNREMTNQRVNGVSKRKRSLTNSSEKRTTKGANSDVKTSMRTPARRMSRIKKRKLVNQMETHTIKKNSNGS